MRSFIAKTSVSTKQRSRGTKVEEIIMGTISSPWTKDLFIRTESSADLRGDLIGMFITELYQDRLKAIFMEDINNVLNNNLFESHINQWGQNLVRIPMAHTRRKGVYIWGAPNDIRIFVDGGFGLEFTQETAALMGVEIKKELETRSGYVTHWMINEI